MPGANLNQPDHSPAPPRLLDAKAVALRLSVTIAAVRAMWKRKEIPPDAAVRLGRRLRFDEAVINRWIGWLRADALDSQRPPKKGASA